MTMVSSNFCEGIKDRGTYLALAALTPTVLTPCSLIYFSCKSVFSILTATFVPTPEGHTYPLKDRAKDIGRSAANLLVIPVSLVVLEVLSILQIFANNQKIRFVVMILIDLNAFNKKLESKQEVNHQWQGITHLSTLAPNWAFKMVEWLKALDCQGPKKVSPQEEDGGQLRQRAVRALDEAEEAKAEAFGLFSDHNGDASRRGAARGSDQAQEAAAEDDILLHLKEESI